MYQLIDGRWVSDGFEPSTHDGEFKRAASTFRGWVDAEGGNGFEAEPGRYHLYVSLACPWAHRTLILRKLKGLESIISVDVVDPHMGEQGWVFRKDGTDAVDSVNQCHALHEIYQLADPRFSGIVTVPVLWDKRRRTIVNNESAEIIRMFNSAFDEWGDASIDLYPPPLRGEIDRINETVYRHVNNGVYRAGFATSQTAYEKAVDGLFSTLDDLESHLADHRYLAGDQLTEADWRLFTTLIRFDTVYYLHFKCNVRRLVDYPRLWAYTRGLYGVPGIAETVNFDHIKRHYYTSHPALNPSGIVPAGPYLDLATGD